MLQSNFPAEGKMEDGEKLGSLLPLVNSSFLCYVCSVLLFGKDKSNNEFRRCIRTGRLTNSSLANFTGVRGHVSSVKGVDDGRISFTVGID